MAVRLTNLTPGAVPLTAVPRAGMRCRARLAAPRQGGPLHEYERNDIGQRICRVHSLRSGCLRHGNVEHRARQDVKARDHPCDRGHIQQQMPRVRAVRTGWQTSAGCRLQGWL